MLKIYFGEMDDVYYGPGWFVNNYTEKWFNDDIVREMIRDIDKSEYRGGELIYSSILGPIAPERLSGGVKTLISIYNNPDLIFDATSCGQNCARWLMEIGRLKNVSVNLRYPMMFDECDDIAVMIENTGIVYHDKNEYAFAALHVLHEERFR